MTAEVAIINSNAVAIAADSAVTIGQGKKIYNSAIKVFSLSKLEPVSIMVYGNAGLLGVPWETIIKIYRSELRDRNFDTLELYAEDFLEFLKDQERFFPAETQDAWVVGNVQGYYEVIRETFFQYVQEELKQKGEINEARTIEILRTTVTEHHERLKRVPFVKGMDADDEAYVFERYQRQIGTLIGEVFQGVKPDRATSGRLRKIAALIHCRGIFSDSTSGVVVSGFGKKDVYPAVCTHEIEGVLNKKLKYHYIEQKSYRIRHGSDCSIIPFAQDDMVASFMEGVNPSVSRFITQYLQQLFFRLPELVKDEELVGTEAEKTKLRQRITQEAEKLLMGFLNQISIHKRIQHIDPILNMVRVLPKDELAAMAESLVNLTAFKRRMTDVLETVGGPIDVAVISKGDGLVWVKRKLYFPKELNQHFFANYFREVSAPDQT